jgi:hypothetical protein
VNLGLGRRDSMAFRYKPVTRMITVEFRPLDKPKGRVEIVVTPEYAVVRSGDTIHWDIQGLPGKFEVTIGNLAAFGTAFAIRLSGTKATFGRPAIMRDANVTLRRGVLTYDTKGVDPGVFKYDILVNGKVVCDPEIEIRGPRGA